MEVEEQPHKCPFPAASCTEKQVTITNRIQDLKPATSGLAFYTFSSKPEVTDCHYSIYKRQAKCFPLCIGKKVGN